MDPLLWDDTDPSHPPAWVQHKLDLAQGYIKRAVDVDARNTPKNPLHVTSLVFDLIKPGGHGTHDGTKRAASAAKKHDA